MGAHTVVLELLQIPYEKVTAYTGACVMQKTGNLYDEIAGCRLILLEIIFCQLMCWPDNVTNELERNSGTHVIPEIIFA